MATTTNYGWTTPDDTALVKDGAAAIRTLGSSVDTTVKALSPGTTSGDLDYYTSGTAKARLGIGSTGQVLTVAAGVPSWANATNNSMTLLSTTTLSGASTTISSISQSYLSLYLLVYGVTNATADGVFYVRPNAVNEGNFSGVTSTPSAYKESDSASILSNSGNVVRTNSSNSWVYQIENYTSSTTLKPISFHGVYNGASNASSFGFGGLKTTAAITSLLFANTGGNLSTGTVLLYGVK